MLDDIVDDEHLFIDDLVAHGITDTVTEDDDMLNSARVYPVVLFNCIHVALSHGFSVDNLFAFHLIVDLREIF